MSATRILLVDDHDVVRQGIRALLEHHSGWEICGEAGSGRVGVEMARTLTPDIVILDIGLPDLNGVDAARHIRQALPHTEVLVLTMHESEALMHQALQAGVRGYVLKSNASRELLNALEALRQHKPYLTPQVADIVLHSYLSPAHTGAEQATTPSDRLTLREREVLQLLAEGHSTKEVAHVLGVSVKTADTHRSNLMRKLDLHSIAALVRYAVRNDLIVP